MNQLMKRTIKISIFMAITVESVLILIYQFMLSKPGPHHPFTQLFGFLHLVSYFFIDYVNQVFRLGISGSIENISIYITNVAVLFIFFLLLNHWYIKKQGY
jgi:predicted ABC-type exoprotein transport system permease subunit